MRESSTFFVLFCFVLIWCVVLIGMCFVFPEVFERDGLI